MMAGMAPRSCSIRVKAASSITAEILVLRRDIRLTSLMAVAVDMSPLSVDTKTTFSMKRLSVRSWINVWNTSL